MTETNNPLVSIITPCFNGEKFVHRLLDSILCQTYKNIEFIFVNDGSTDNTEQMILSYKQKFTKRDIKFIYIHKKNGGQASAINEGLKIFKGKYLTWPDSDDWLTDDAIEKKVNFLEENQEYGFVISKLMMKNEKLHDVELYWREPSEDDNYFLDLIIEKNPYFAPVGNLVRSDVLREAIPSMKIYESPAGQNWQLLLPISYHSSIGYIDEVLGYILVRENSHSRQEHTKEELLRKTYIHEDCLINTLISLNPDNKSCYLNIVNIKYARKRLKLGYKFKDKELLKINYNKLRELNSRTLKDKIYYYCSKHKILSFGLNI